MQEKELLHLAQQEGFCAAAVIKADEIVFNGAFRKFCEDNVCGRFPWILDPASPTVP